MKKCADRSKSPTRLETPKSRLKAAVSKSKMRAITAGNNASICVTVPVEKKLKKVPFLFMLNFIVNQPVYAIFEQQSRRSASKRTRCSLINAFVVHCLDSVTVLFYFFLKESFSLKPYIFVV